MLIIGLKWGKNTIWERCCNVPTSQNNKNKKLNYPQKNVGLAPGFKTMCKAS